MKIRFILLIAAITAVSFSQAQDEKPELSLGLAYHALNNKVPSLQVSTRYKSEKGLENVKGIKVKIYITEESEATFLGELVTNDKGLAKLWMPASAKATWDTNTLHKFIAVSSATEKFAETKTEAEISNTRIAIDTTLTDEGKRAVSVTVTTYDGYTWVPAPDVDLKIGVQRLGGYLPISEEESYTTDSSGTVIAEFQLDSLPATDKQGNLVLAVIVEDNDSYGNLIVEKQVPWGIVYERRNDFIGRSLWATSDKAPLWLMFMAYSIVAGVWAVIFYLVYLLVRIKKSGKAIG